MTEHNHNFKEMTEHNHNVKEMTEVVPSSLDLPHQSEGSWTKKCANSHVTSISHYPRLSHYPRPQEVHDEGRIA